jgi:H+-translocating diphosphatase
VFLK